MFGPARHEDMPACRGLCLGLIKDLSCLHGIMPTVPRNLDPTRHKTRKSRTRLARHGPSPSSSHGRSTINHLNYQSTNQPKSHLLLWRGETNLESKCVRSQETKYDRRITCGIVAGGGTVHASRPQAAGREIPRGAPGLLSLRRQREAGARGDDLFAC
jgi:hypothetical protein